MKLKIKYMIGDDHGKTSYKADVDPSNPILPIITSTLDKLVPLEGHWGIALNSETLEYNLKNGNISQVEHDVFMAARNDDDELAVKHGFESDDLADFCDIFYDDTEYSFLTYQGYKLK